MIYVFIFAAAFVVELIFAEYTYYLIDQRAWQAASLSTMIVLVQQVVNLSIFDRPFLLVPLVVGAWFGTYVATKWRKSHHGHSPEN